MSLLTTLLSVTLSALLAGIESPSEQSLLGEWHCSGNIAVCMEGAAVPADDAGIGRHLIGMGATADNCTLSFEPGHKCMFRLGEKSFRVSWSLDSVTKEFKATVGLFSIKGYLTVKDDRLILIYSRNNLIMMMWYLCTPEGRQHIKPLGKCLDAGKSLTAGIEFSR